MPRSRTASSLQTRLRRVIYAPDTPGGSPDFQPHHQPFNYYAAFDPATRAAQRAAHLKDYQDLLADIDAGRLPPVAFYKPQGNLESASRVCVDQPRAMRTSRTSSPNCARAAMGPHGHRDHLR